MAFPHNSDSPEGVKRQLADLPFMWTVRKSHTFTKLIDGFNALLFCWVGVDRTGVIRRVTQVVSDKQASIEGTITGRTERYAALVFLIRHRIGNPKEHQQVLQDLAANLEEQFANDPLEGTRFKVRGTARMLVRAPDEPGVLNKVTQIIADLKPPLNICKLAGDALDGFSPKMCRLRFKLELPTDEPRNTLAKLKKRIQKTIPKATVRFSDAVERKLRAPSPRDDKRPGNKKP